MDKFKQSENPDDNYFMVSFKQAGKKADKLQSDLQTACNALEYIIIEDNNCFGEDFLNNLMDFSRATAGNNNVQDKVESLKTLSAERGIVMHQTNISPEQVKAQLPVFTGASSLSVVDALDT